MCVSKYGYKRLYRCYTSQQQNIRLIVNYQLTKAPNSGIEQNVRK